MFTFRKPNQRRPVIVVFAGGMGTQIIQAAVYFSLKSQGRVVFGDVTYFNRPQDIAIPGEKGALTHWGWQLEHYGLFPASFDCPPPSLSKRTAEILRDGERMISLGLNALRSSDIRARFTVPNNLQETFPELSTGDFLCIHVRRGDYVNVASHLTSDKDLLAVALKFARLCDKVVILSDSPIGVDYQAALSPLFNQVYFYDNINAISSHHIMRSARALICSNSTFSLTAAILNSEALSVIPRTWYGAKQRQIEQPIHECSQFEIFNFISV
jgi:hypothetical protein